MKNYFDGLSEAEILAEVEKLRGELVEMNDDQQRYLDYRKRRGRQTFTDKAMSGQQETLQKAIDLIEKMRAEWQRP